MSQKEVVSTTHELGVPKIKVSAQVELKRGANLATTQKKFAEKLVDYLSVNQQFKFAKVSTMLDATEGVLDFVNLRINGSIQNVEVTPGSHLEVELAKASQSFSEQVMERQALRNEVLAAFYDRLFESSEKQATWASGSEVQLAQEYLIDSGFLLKENSPTGPHIRIAAKGIDQVEAQRLGM